MADTAAENRSNEVYYCTARVLGTGTTSTVTLKIWKLLTDHLLKHQAPMSATQLMQATGLSFEEIENIFSQSYYQKYYGFRRFESYEAWKEWALSEGVLYNPELHDPKPGEAEAAAQAEAAGESEGAAANAGA